MEITSIQTQYTFLNKPLKKTSQAKRLFDPHYYMAVNYDLWGLNIDPWNHYVQYGRIEGRLPNPLFDPVYYLLTNPDLILDDIDPLEHYLQHSGEGLNPHPLFNCAHYLKQINGKIKKQTPLEHFLDTGWKMGLSPTPFFNFDFYYKAFPDVKEAGTNPMVHYLMHGEIEGRLPYGKFNIQLHQKPRDLNHWNPLSIFLRSRLSFFVMSKHEQLDFQNIAIAPIHEVFSEPTNNTDETSALKANYYRLFDGEYYSEVNPKAKGHPLNHYRETGYKSGLFPNLFFDPTYYAKKYLDGSLESDPFLHFMEAADYNNPHPLFDTAYYMEKLASADIHTSKNNLFDYFLTQGWKKEVYPTPHFDAQYYVKNFEESEIPEGNLLLHYLAVGENQNIAPSEKFSPLKYEKPFPGSEIEENKFGLTTKLALEVEGFDLPLCTPLVRFKRSLDWTDPSKPTFIFVSHDASRTGAPLIVLKLAQQFKQFLDVNIVSILCDGGELESDFEALGPSYLFFDYYKWSQEIIRPQINSVLEMLQPFQPLAAIVNSAESRDLLPYLSQKDIPCISLVHEMASLYKDWIFQKIHHFSSKVVFPSKPVEVQARSNAFFANNIAVIRGQGLLKPDLLIIDKAEARRKLRAELNLPEDAKIVLSCGSLTGRKGTDIFTFTAFLTLESAPENTYFIWLGGGHRHLLDNLFWLQTDIRKKGLEDKILFVGQKSETEHYFVGSDAFYLTSREDPFPCVIHEAMAARIPILGFTDSGGIVDALGNGEGKLLPYGDLLQARDTLLEWLTSPEKTETYVQKALQKVQQEYDFVNYTKYIAQLAENVIQEFPDLLGHPTFAEFEKRVESFPSPPPATQKKRVVFTIPNWKISGVNTIIERLIMALNERGFDAYLLFTTNFSAKLEAELMPKVPYQFLSIKQHEPKSIWKKLQSHLEDQAPCVFFPNHDYLASALSPALSNDIGIVGVLHSDDTEHYEHGYRLGMYWNRIVCVSKQIEEQMNQYNPVFEKKSSVIYSGVDIDEQLKLPEKNEKFSIIYTGRLVQYQKRILDFIKIIEKFDQKGIPFVFTFIGEGSEGWELRKGLKSYIEAGKVRMLGRQSIEVIFEELKKHHVFALFSDFEGLPISLIEAMGHYCVPLVTEIESGIQEILVQDENAKLSPIGDVEKFVDTLVDLASDQEAWERLAINSFKTLSEKGLFASKMVENYAQLITEVFEEIESQSFNRPKALTFKSSNGDILIPPMMQEVV
jgi:glycosyltransferase involved in cell wall biosynthesis